MDPAITQHLPAVRSLCSRFGVRSLSLFGSAATGGFDPGRSDLDFIVDFGDVDLGPWMSRFFEFQRELESLLGRRVDLVLASALSGTRGEAIEAVKVPLYAAA